MELTELRKKIDAIDAELVQLFVQRMELAAQIAQYKKENSLPIYVPERELEVLQSISKKAGPEMEDYTRALYTTLFALSRNYQKEKIG